jgi:hypothetical protein
MKFLKFSLATLVFLGVLVCVYLVHVNYFAVDVVFYSALADVVIAAILSWLLMQALRYLADYSGFEMAQVLIIWLLIGYALAISVPTLLDRSLSFYLLEKLDQRGGGIQLDSLEQVFTQEYVKEHRVMDVRLTEQLESGTVRVSSGCVMLTRWGERLAGFSRFFRLHFLPKKRLLIDEYSDDLTDPFRDGAPARDYDC